MYMYMYIITVVSRASAHVTALAIRMDKLSAQVMWAKIMLQVLINIWSRNECTMA